MRQALGLARRGLGQTWPNPSVGCVLVRDALPIARGWTQPGGRPHAEAEALARAGDGARGATAYVTLEPCAHHGKTPPCADALVAAGIARCVVAIEDPDPRVAGGGLAKLRAAGIDVVAGVLAEEARAIAAPFLTRLEKGRPLVTVKLAVTLDGRIAAAGGDSQWITGPLARQRAHLLRAEHDATMVAAGTALADNPLLNVRLPGFAPPQRVRVVVDGRLRPKPDSQLARTARQAPFWLLTRPDASAEARAALTAMGVEVIDVEPEADVHVNLSAALAELGRRGLTSVLVEGGGSMAAALLAGNLVDRLAIFTAPAVLGGDAVAAFGPLGLDKVANMRRWRLTGSWPLSDDRLDIFEVRV